MTKLPHSTTGDPRMAELTPEEWEMEDPLAEERDMPVQGVTHRYPDRVLFYITQNCAMFCRHCTESAKLLILQLLQMTNKLMPVLSTSPAIQRYVTSLCPAVIL